MNLKNKLHELCRDKMTAEGFTAKEYTERLKYELIEIDIQDKVSYFLKHHVKGTRWAENDHNILVPYLLDLCPAPTIDEEPASVMGEYPDIDLDYIEPVRDHLRNKWAPEVFGDDKVAFICTYQTYNLKGALLDMARVFSLDRQEIQSITKSFGDKDDDGGSLTWESAESMYPAFRKWIENNPEAADAAQKLHGRNRNMSQHAGGFIISNQPLEGFVPMVRNKKDGSMMTAWTEGQTSQDLMEVGLVKFDTLGSKMQEQIVECVGLILKRYNKTRFCAIDDGPNWSDDAYLNDPLAIKAANAGDLRFIFQFDSDGIRRLVRKGGVTRFQDLEAYSALYRPGTLNSGMHNVYCDRKQGKEEYTVHPALQQYLGKTYGVLVYQEQIMQVLHAAGKILLRDGYDVVKAISKKKIEKFAKHKDQFIESAQKVLDITLEESQKMWGLIEEFAAYGFNKAHTCAYTMQSSRQLYLKCHYPLEYFCTMLNHIRGDDNKLRDCVRQAESHGVKVNPININYSQGEAAIHSPGKPCPEDEIYFGLSNIKFVGKEAADKIVALREDRPFTDFRDFLDRFGTEAKVVQALVSLHAFDDADPLTLWKYYEFYKDRHKKRTDRHKRFNSSMQNYAKQLMELTDGMQHTLSEEQFDLAEYRATDEEVKKKLRRVKGNYRRSMTNAENKEREEKDNFIPPLEEFDATIIDESKIKEDVMETLQDKEKAELQFFGFCWSHPLDNCSDAQGFTFERFKIRVEPDSTGRVEGVVIESKETTSRKGNKYGVVKLVDRNWEAGYINVWLEEYERFKNVLRVGNIINIELCPPDPKFNGSRYSIKSYPKWKRHLMPPLDSDVRAVRLKPVDIEPETSPVTLDDNESQTTLNILKRANANLRREDDRGPDYERDVQLSIHGGSV